MSKKPSLNFRKVVKIIKEAGFELDHTSGSHYVFYNPVSKMRELSLITIKIYLKGL